MYEDLIMQSYSSYNKQPYWESVIQWAYYA